MTSDADRFSPLFDDNPAVQDLLGFKSVAEAVVRVLGCGELDPVTIGVQGAWGGGKSTVLNLIENELDSVGHVLVVRIDPWEFDDNQDVRGTLIALVLNALQAELASGKVEIESSRLQEIAARLDHLRRRIAWGRVAQVLVTSAVSLVPGGGALAPLVELLTPAGPPVPGQDGQPAAAVEKPQSMAGFREEFEALMLGELGLQKVVVLVDDLDRCLPAATVATLEAIKLFLSVKKMAFVIAADEDLVRASVDKHLGGMRNGAFAALYTEKIVQIPVSLPVLTKDDAEAYMALLLGSRSQMDGSQEAAVVQRALDRRRAGKAPYVVPDEEGASGPSPDVLVLAATVANGLSADKWQTPRAVKRFLNNLSIREHITRAAGADLPLNVLVRMYVLELRHLAEFKHLAGLPADGRAALLKAWEAWGHDEDGADRPDGVSEQTKAWARTKPSLVGREAEIGRYLSLAATLRSDVRFGGAMDAGQRELVEQMLHDSDEYRRGGVEAALATDLDTQEVLVHALGDHIVTAEDPEHVIESLTRLAAGNPDAAPAVVAVLSRPANLAKLAIYHVPQLDDLPEVLTTITTTPGLDDEVVSAAHEFLRGR